VWRAKKARITLAKDSLPAKRRERFDFVITACFSREEDAAMQSVYVIGANGKPLMPCSPRKARLLLKSGTARVKQRTPFAIQLTRHSGGYMQPVSLGVDAGSKHIGVAAVSNGKVIFAVDVQPRNDVVKLLSTRRELRRSRRNRKTRYRQPRFENRVHSKHKGWLAPSVEVKIGAHLSIIATAYKILPITKIVVETAEFDLQRLKAMLQGKPLPVGTDYQKGEQYDHYNVRQYVLWRDGYTCQCCGAHSSRKQEVKLIVHHLGGGRKTEGNAPDVLIAICEDCHKQYHKGLIQLPNGSKRRRKSTRDAAFMGIMRETLMARLKRLYPRVFETYGYITKAVREAAELPKSHINDAICITGLPFSKYDGQFYIGRQIRKHNRQIYKQKILRGGLRKRNQAPYLVKGFRLFDMVRYHGQKCFLTGRRTSGYFALKRLDGTTVSNSANFKEIVLLMPKQSLLFERRTQG
jgi:N6-L-threonylcarbamoyladenine synthase